MKKIIGVLIVFSFLFSINETSAVLFLPCLGGSDGSCLYSCGGRTYNSQDSSYKQCIETEKNKAEQLRIEKERLETEAKQKIYNEREDEISIYKDFFQKVGVNLTLDTDEEQYNKWLKELKEEKADYIKEQENLQKIKELEERISSLESKPIIVEKIITPTSVINTLNKEEVIKPTVNDNKIIKPVIKKDIEVEKILPIVETSNVIEAPTITETPIIHTKKSILQKIFDWFKSF